MRGAARPLDIQLRIGVHTGEVLVSCTVADWVAGSGLECEDRGADALRSVPGEWRLFRHLR